MIARHPGCCEEECRRDQERDDQGHDFGEMATDADCDQRIGRSRFFAGQVTEQSRIRADPREADGRPRDECKRKGAGERRSRAQKPPRQRQPNDQRPEKELQRDCCSHCEGGPGDAVTPSPRNRNCQQEQWRHRAEIDRASRERIRRGEGVAAPVPEPQQPERDCDRGEREKRPEKGRHRRAQRLKGRSEKCQHRRVRERLVSTERVRRSPVDDLSRSAQEDRKIVRSDPSVEESLDARHVVLHGPHRSDGGRCEPGIRRRTPKPYAPRLYKG